MCKLVLLRRTFLREAPVARVAVLAAALFAWTNAPLALADEPEGQKPDRQTSADDVPAPEAKETESASESNEPSALDQQLLEGLDSELLKDLDGGAAGGDAGAAGEDLGEAGEQDPLTRISERMRVVEGLIEKPQQRPKTEQLQQQIVGDLAALIKELEKQCAACQQGASSQSQQTAQRGQVKQPKPGSSKPGGQNQSNKPARDSTDRLGKDDVQKPDMEEMADLMKALWGELPARAREQMLQTPPDQFLPKYEILIEKYYKRLAEEQRDRP